MKFAYASLLVSLAGPTLGDDILAKRQNTPICGITGTKSQLPFSVSVLRSERSPTGCMNFCKRSRSCRSFAVSSTFCWLFNNAGGANFKYNAASNYKVWDVGCTISTATSATTTTSTATTGGSSVGTDMPVAEPDPTQDPVPGDSPAVTNPGEDGIFPSEDPDFSKTYTYTQYALPTVAIMGSPPNSVGFPQPTSINVPCVIDPTKTSEQFNLLDSDFMPIVPSGTSTLVPLASPTSEAQANAMGDASKYPLPAYYFEKPAGAPADIYDIVVLAGSTPRYLAKLNDGRVVLTTSSTGPKVVNRGGQQMQTTVFKVDCKSKITVLQNGQPFSLDKSGRTVRTTAGTTAKGMIAHPLKAIKARRTRKRSIYNEGLVPRCPKNPEQLVCRDKKDASPPSANGCGSVGTEWVPDFTFTEACNRHDLCYAGCGSQFNKCNEEFFNNMVDDGCTSKKHWYMWLIYGACVRAAEFYANVVASPLGAKAFIDTGSKRCTCMCPNPTQLCGSTPQNAYCTNIFSNERENCGACGRTCPEGTKCKGGNCVCPIDQCGTTCLDLRQNPNHCGACNNACPTDKPYCLKGACIAAPKECVPSFPNPNFEGNWHDDWKVDGCSECSTGYDAGYDDNGESEFYVVTPKEKGQNTVEFSTTITACPRQRYTLGYGMFRDQGSDSCDLTITAGGRQISSITIPKWDESGNDQRLKDRTVDAGSFQAGDSVQKNGLSLNVPLAFTVKCSGVFADTFDAQSQVRFGHFKLTAA